MLNRFLDFIQTQQLFSPAKDNILLAVSGGLDSTAMAHFFAEAGIKFGIAHCNFQLRGKEADEDEASVKRLSEKTGAACHSVRFDTEKYATDHKVSIQMAARELRYKWLEKIRRENAFDYIATAHHKNDIVETILINLVRGTGIAGLHGILPKRGYIIRPMLFAIREEIEAYIAEKKLAYREDSSNYSTKYLRNNIRHQVTPILKEMNPDLENTIGQMAERMREAEQIIKEAAEAKRKDIFVYREGRIELPIGKIRQLSPQKLLLHELLAPYGFSETAIPDLIHSLDSQPGKRFFSSTHFIIRDRDCFILRNIKQLDNLSYSISEKMTECTLSNVKFQFSKPASSNLTLRPDQSVAYLDFDKLQFPLAVRNWKEGDYFIPFGMQTKKKLSDFFVAQKVSLDKKREIPLFVSGEDIVWVAGMRIDDRYKITNETKMVYVIEMIHS